MASAKKPVIYIDAAAILGARKSGIGHVLLSTLRTIDTHLRNGEFPYDVKLITPFHKLAIVRSYHFTHIDVQPTLCTGKVMTVLSWTSIPFPASLWRKGIYIFPNYRNLALFPGSKSLTYLHDICFLIYPEMIEQKNLERLRRYIPLWVRRTDCIVTVSQNSASEISHVFPGHKDKIRVILNGIDRPSQVNPQIDVRKNFNLPRKYLLFLSNIEPRKNIRGLLDAYLSLGKEYSQQVGLVIVGADGWKSEDVLSDIKKAQDEGFVIIHPQVYVDDTQRDALLANATALIMPSFHEGFSLPPLEAIVAGTPVIVSDIPVHREILGDMARYVSLDDPQELKSQLLRVADGPYMEKVRTATVAQSQVILEQYSWNNSIDSLTRIIEELV